MSLSDAITIRLVTYRPSGRYGHNFDREGEDRLSPAEKQALDRLVGLLEKVGNLPVEHVCLFGSLGRRATVIGKARSVRSAVDGRAAVDIRFAFFDRGVLQKQLDNDPWPLFNVEIPWEQAGAHQVSLGILSKNKELDQQPNSAPALVENIFSGIVNGCPVIIRAKGGSDDSALNTLVRSAVRSWRERDQLTFITPIIEPIPDFRLQGMENESVAPSVFVWVVSPDARNPLVPRRHYWRMGSGLVLLLAIFAGGVIYRLFDKAGDLKADLDSWKTELKDWGASSAIVKGKLNSLEEWPEILKPLGARYDRGERDWSGPNQVKDQLKAFDELLSEWKLKTKSDTPEGAGAKLAELETDYERLKSKLPPDEQREIDHRELLDSARSILDEKALTTDWIGRVENWIKDYKKIADESPDGSAEESGAN